MDIKQGIKDKLFGKEDKTFDYIRKASYDGSEKTIGKLRKIYSKTDDEYTKNYTLIAIANNYNNLGNGAEALKALGEIKLDKLKKHARELCRYFNVKRQALVLERAEKLEIEMLYSEAKPYFESYKEHRRVRLYTAGFESYFGNHGRATELLLSIDCEGDEYLEFDVKFALAMEYVYAKDLISVKKYLEKCAEIRPSKELREIQDEVEKMIQNSADKS